MGKFIENNLRAEISPRRLLVISIASAVITAALNCIPALEGSSFTAPAETLELWIVLAVYIIMNCKSYREAAVKTFLFFLISQPLIYLLEVPFKSMGWGLFRYYPYWGLLTLLTIPGALIAYRVKKDDFLAAIILSVANVLMILTGTSRLGTVVYDFPRMLLAVLFCLGMPFALIYFSLKNRRSRTVAIVIAAAVIALGGGKALLFPERGATTYPVEEGCWSVAEVPSGLDITLEDESMTIQSRRPGEYTVTLISEDGRIQKYAVTVEGDGMRIGVSELP